MLNKITNYLYIYNLYTHKMFFDPLSSFNNSAGKTALPAASRFLGSPKQVKENMG